MNSWSALAIYGLAGLGCSSTMVNSDAAVSRVPLCDGVPHLRLWVLVPAAADSRGSTVRVENGYSLLAIDGTCNYWIGGGWYEDPLARDRPVRTGKVSDADTRALEETLPLDNLVALADCPPPPSGLFDYSMREIRSEMATAACVGSAPELTAGTRFEAAWRTVQTIAKALWEVGVPMDGAIHISAAKFSGITSTPPPYAWLVAEPLSSFILSDDKVSQRGVSRLVDDQESTRHLRTLRDQYLADRTAQPGLFVNWDGLTATDAATTANVYMRDAIPYEDARGLLKF